MSIKKHIWISTVLIAFSSSVSADSTWKITFSEVQPNELFTHIESMFGLTVQNPDAACLKEKVTYKPTKWAAEQEKELTRHLMKAAGCNVEFHDKTYTLSGNLKAIK